MRNSSVLAPSYASALYLLWISHFMLDFCTGIFPVYKTIAGFDLTKAALISGICGFVGEISQVIFGRLGDQGKRKVFLILGVLLASSAFFLPFTTSLSSAGIIVFLIMLGSGTFHPSAAGLSGLANPTTRTSNLAIFASGGAIGLGFSQICFSSLFSLYYFLPLLLFIPAGFAIYKCYKFPFYDPHTADENSGFFGLIFGKLFKMKSLALLYCIQICNYGFIFALTFFLPDILKEKGAAVWLWKGGGHLLLIAGGGLMLPTLGKICSRFGHYPVLLISGIFGISLFSLFLFFNHIPNLLLALLLFYIGASLGTMSPLSVSWGIKIAPQYPSTVGALLMGFAWGIGDLFTALSSIIIKLSPEHGVRLSLAAATLLFCTGLFLLKSISVSEKQESSDLSIN